MYSSQPANGAGSLNVCLMRSSDVVCCATVGAEKSLQESGGNDGDIFFLRLLFPIRSCEYRLVRQQLYTQSQEEKSSRKRKGIFNWIWKRKSKRTRAENAYSITFCFESIDNRARAEIEVIAAKRSIRHIETLIERTERREEAIGTFMNVADGIIAIVDNIAQVSFVGTVASLVFTFL